MTYLGIAAAVWSAAGIGGIVLGLTSGPWLLAQLPALVIDAAALGGATTAIGVGLLLLGLTHLGVLVAMRAELPRALSGALLLSASMAVVLLALAAAAATSAIRTPASAAILLAAALAVALGAAGYGRVAGGLIGQIRAGGRA